MLRLTTALITALLASSIQPLAAQVSTDFACLAAPSEVPLFNEMREAFLTGNPETVVETSSTSIVDGGMSMSNESRIGLLNLLRAIMPEEKPIDCFILQSEVWTETFASEVIAIVYLDKRIFYFVAAFHGMGPDGTRIWLPDNLRFDANYAAIMHFIR